MDQNQPPTPAPIAGPGASDMTSPPPEMATPEQRQQLLTMIDQIKSKLSGFHAQNFAGQNKLELVRRDLLKQVFQKLQMAGVDLSDQQSVAAFIANLQQQNPQLAQQFEQAMSILLGDGTSGFMAPPGQPIPGDPSQDPNQQIPQPPQPPNDQALPQGI